MARSKVPSRQEHARLWAKLEFRDRRRILKSVGRGQGLENRKEARIGVGVARQQQRYWRWAWLFGPAIGVVQIPEWIAVITTAFVGTLLMGGMAVYRIRNARAAEQANLDRIGAR